MECSKQVLLEHSTTFSVFNCTTWMKCITAIKFTINLFLKINEADEVKNHIHSLCNVFYWIYIRQDLQMITFSFISVLYCIQLLWSQGCIDGLLWNCDTFDTRTVLIIIMSNTNYFGPPHFVFLQLLAVWDQSHSLIYVVFIKRIKKNVTW